MSSRQRVKTDVKEPLYQLRQIASIYSNASIAHEDVPDVYNTLHANWWRHVCPRAPTKPTLTPARGPSPSGSSSPRRSSRPSPRLSRDDIQFRSLIATSESTPMDERLLDAVTPSSLSSASPNILTSLCVISRRTIATASSKDTARPSSPRASFSSLSPPLQSRPCCFRQPADDDDLRASPSSSRYLSLAKRGSWIQRASVQCAPLDAFMPMTTAPPGEILDEFGEVDSLFDQVQNLLFVQGLVTDPCETLRDPVARAAALGDVTKGFDYAEVDRRGMLTQSPPVLREGVL
ncbi:hypothetical protein LZ32DRAFT_663774 [Colletotrichum eremochloae]|nr:hypothetical protein LZ32DRAFT_663774 [Colletotrichum eremochloae]